MKRFLTFLFLVLGLCVLFNSPLLAQNGPLQANLEKAYEYSWDQRYEEAIRIFDQVLSADPNLLDAELGRAWTLAWDGQYDAARKSFGAILEKHPEHFEAGKGLAYTALWSGQYKHAIQRFRNLLTEKPEEEDLHMAIGLARVNAGFLKGARTSYRTLDLLQSPEAPALLSAIHHAPAWLEVNSWAGFSSQSRQQKWGLRAFRVAINPDPTWGVFARYDNSLSLDGMSTVQLSNNIPSLFAGGIVRPTKSLSTRIEVGMRDHPASELSWILLGEQAIWLKEGIALKLGGLYDVGNASHVSEHLFYSGLAARIGKRLWLEPMIFQTFRADKSGGEQRFSLSAKYNWSKGYEIQIGGLYGRQKTDFSSQRTPISGSWLRYQHPIGGRHWVYLLLRRERTQVMMLHVVAIGLQIRLER